MGFWNWLVDEDEEDREEGEEYEEEDGPEEYEESEEEEEGGDGPDEAELLVRLERAFRTERAGIRETSDVQALRRLRGEYEALLRQEGLRGAVAMRANDLLELIDERITDLRATQRAKGGGDGHF